jgi:hypothetical protein
MATKVQAGLKTCATTVVAEGFSPALTTVVAQDFSPALTTVVAQDFSPALTIDAEISEHAEQIDLFGLCDFCVEWCTCMSSWLYL